MSDRPSSVVGAARELGFKRVWLYTLHRLETASGVYRLRTPCRPFPAGRAPKMHLDLLPLPSREELRRLLVGRLDDVIAEADEIAAGRLHLFGGEPVALVLTPPGKLTHWTVARADQGDIKLVWEPARFGWIFALGRAYLLSGDERYPQAFWQRWEEFQGANPVNQGVHWQSAQEVALRLITLSWAACIFNGSTYSTADRKARLAASLVDHANRIPPTLVYARAQDNNHLVSEAAGLYTAGVLLPDFPQALRWKKLGWQWFNRALQSQIEDDGEYIQHSTNYHRMVLQLALFVESLAKRAGEYLPSSTYERLGAATRWLLAHLDPLSGQVVNLGHNDGSNPLPLAAAEFNDYRPVIQAASLAFLGRAVLPAGVWDEYALWLNLPLNTPVLISRTAIAWRIDQADGWASMRARRYSTRPAHADQLHVDLWHRGRYILLDPGTYSYNAAPPWQNGLASASVHNSLALDGAEPMRRAGRFLWLAWDQAEWDLTATVPGQRLTAWRDGYDRLGLRHRRSLESLAPGEWLVSDEVIALRPLTGSHQAILHWLLPDGEWSLEGQIFSLELPELCVTISLDWPPEGVSWSWLRLVRAGQVIHGPPGEVEQQGWYSPTYMHRIPAISYQLGLGFAQPLTIRSMIKLKSIE